MKVVQEIIDYSDERATRRINIVSIVRREGGLAWV
jgi:hypothetical protein